MSEASHIVINGIKIQPHVSYEGKNKTWSMSVCFKNEDTGDNIAVINNLHSAETLESCNLLVATYLTAVLLNYKKGK